MSLTYTYNGSALTADIAPTSLELPSRAEGGEAIFGGLAIDDPAAAITLVGHKPFTVEESDCSQPRLFTGWTTERAIGRSVDRGLFVGEDARLHDVTLVDLNAVFGFRVVHGAEARRPAETWTQRRDWLLGTSYLSGLIYDTGYVMDLAVERDMEARDYIGSYPSDVFADLVDRVGERITYFAFWDPVAEKVGLFLNYVGADIGDSDLYVSNDPADVDGDTVFAPDTAAVVSRAPDQVYSDVLLEWANGRIFRRRTSTETRYIKRGVSISRPYCKSKAMAQKLAEAYLDRHDTEVDRLTLTIRVPSTRVGLVTAGQRLSVKLTHLPGYADWTSMRVVQCAPKPVDDIADWWDVALELVMPKAGGGPAPADTCSYAIVGAYDGTSEDIFGATVSTLGYVPGTAHAVTATSVNCSTNGTPNNGSLWGVPAGVWDGGTMSADWTWDLDDLGSPAICTALLDVQGQSTWGLLSLLGSANGTDWTEIVAAESTKLYPFSSPYPQYRYIRLHWEYTAAGGLQYYGGVQIFWLMLWEGETDETADLGSNPGQTITDSDPTTGDDVDAGSNVGDTWVNSDTGETFVLVDNTAGAAVWTPITNVNLALDALSDVDTTGVSDGDALVFDSGTATWGPGSGGASVLDDLTDVNAPTPTDQDVLTWDTTAGEWIAQAAGGGGDVATDAIWDAKGDLAGGTGADTAAKLTVGANGYVLTADSGETTGMKWAAAPGASGGDASGQIVGGFDGGGAAVTAGSIFFAVAPFDGTITGWRILGTPSGNVEFDVAVCSAGALPAFPGDSIVASAPPAMTSDTEVSGSTLTGWTTAITAGDNIAIKVASATVTWASLTLAYSRP